MNSKKPNALFKWFKRIITGLLVIVGVLIVVIAGSIIYDTAFGLDIADYVNTEYSNVQGETLQGYLAMPEGEGPHPAVLLIHEWWGLNDGITTLADALAEEGYVVFAPDAYRGEVTTIIPRAFWMISTTPNEQIFADVDSGLAYLRGLENVDPDRVASMGFCFGGGHSLQLGLRQSENLAVTILYYGALVTEPELLRSLVGSQPVLGIFAEEDQMIFPEDVLEFEAALNSLDIENEITIYEGVPHGFVQGDNFDQPGASMDAWQQAVAFLDKNLK